MPRRATRGVTASTTHNFGPATPRPRQPAGTPEEIAASSEATHEQIASRAYEIYLARGEGDGDALSDWLTSERELRERALVAADMKTRPGPDRDR
jgi:hypothetical protein